jgi:hypothetical protein
MPHDPIYPKPESEPADELETLLMEAMEGMELADQGAEILRMAQEMAKAED